MILENLRLVNFRIYDQTEIAPDPRFNIIVGLNGQGKTSLLEAIGLLAFLRSFRQARNTEMLRLQSEEGIVTGRVRQGDLTYDLAVRLWPHRKQATINKKTCRYLSEYVCRVSAVSFSPSDLEIIRGAPENRRLWIDKLAQIDQPTHADAVVRYQKILEHRNRQLKAVAEGRASKLPDDFVVWTEELISRGSEIIHNRIHSVEKSVDKIAQYYTEISHENLTIGIRYLSDIIGKDPYGQRHLSSLELIDQAFRKSLDASLKKELILGTTIVGPHRDDLEFDFGGNPVKAFGSQGEVRSLVLAMRLTEVEAYRKAQEVDPILLIDDFSSELDARRRKFLLGYLARSSSQVFLTTTEDLNLGKVFFVEKGRIVLHDNGTVGDEQQHSQ